MPSKKPVTKRPPKTIKEKKFVKAYLETGNGTKAALMAYDVKNENVARSLAAQTLAKLSMDHWFHEAGLTNEVIAQNTTRIALTATKTNEYTGEVLPDNGIQLSAMKFAAQMMGLVKAGDINISNTQNNITVTPILSGLTQEENGPAAPS